ncbi:DoxX family protein [Comamonas aquatica]|uniref:DoxX family protein n=1 Tax=Comamonas aquatica TaxID=225991 RepID=A0AA42W347_9BURK|nr:DoxX family protein [Comamonas aquatica]MDH1428571.1 DoxX family protein [Comamonas aquatica]MDH1606710.1 DoxX family protein [Comamonas aquatica]MDH1618427.1 DoxX family protein [Comamonas aquatica]MDH2006452.1 DoxX family protein [Comamonas aquatica]
MNNSLQDTLALVGRLLLAWLFVPAGFGKIAGFSGAVGYATSVGLPLPEVGVAVGLLIELLGGLMLLVGFMVRPAAVLLAFFTLVASFFFHAYWSLPADQAIMQQLMFNKNLAISGGLLAFAAFGAGRWSLDAKRQRV